MSAFLSAFLSVFLSAFLLAFLSFTALSSTGFSSETALTTGATISGALTAGNTSNIGGWIVNNGILYSFWLPTDIQIDIGLAVQPNLLKTRKQWTLKGYKSGVLLTNDGKNPLVEIPGKMDYKTLASITQYNLKYTQDGDADNVSPECTCLTGTDKLGFIPSGWTW